MYYLLNLQYLARQQKQIFCTLLALCTFDLREGRILRQCFQCRSVIFSNLDTAAHSAQEGLKVRFFFHLIYGAHLWHNFAHLDQNHLIRHNTIHLNVSQKTPNMTHYDTLGYLWYLWRGWPEVFVRGPGGGLWAICRPLLRICQMLFTGSRLNPKAVKNNIFLLPKKTVNWKDFQHWEDGRPCLHFQHKHPAQSKRHQSIFGYFAYTNSAYLSKWHQI